MTASLYFAKVPRVSLRFASVWMDPNAHRLAEVLADVCDVQTMQNFLRDVMTEKEILEISARLEVAELLTNGVTYASISERTGLSSRTIARISDWMKDGCGAYKTVLGSSLHHGHTMPVRAG